MNVDVKESLVLLDALQKSLTKTLNTIQCGIDSCEEGSDEYYELDNYYGLINTAIYHAHELKKTLNRISPIKKG